MRVLERRMAELEELSDELRQQLDAVLAWLERGDASDADSPRRRRWGIRRIAGGVLRLLRRTRRGEPPGWTSEPEVRVRVAGGAAVAPWTVAAGASADADAVLDWERRQPLDEALVDVARWAGAAENAAFVELRPADGGEGWLWRRAVWEAAPDRAGRLGAAVEHAQGPVVGVTVGRGAGPLDGPVHPGLARAGRRHVVGRARSVEQVVRRVDPAGPVAPRAGETDVGIVVASDDPRDAALITALARELAPVAAVVTTETSGGADLAERLRATVVPVWDLGAGLAPELHGDTVASLAAALGWRWAVVVGDGRLLARLGEAPEGWSAAHVPVAPDQVVRGVSATVVAVDDAIEAAARAAGTEPLRWLPASSEAVPERLHDVRAGADELRRRFGVPAGRPLVAAAGPLVPAERPEDVVAVARRLADEELAFLVAGEGPLHGSLHDLVRYHGLDNVVVARDASAADAVAAADVVLCPGEPHPYPESLALAVATGVPVVAVDSPAARALTAGLGEEGRVLVPAPGDVDALAEAVRRLAGRRFDPPPPRPRASLRDLLAEVERRAR